MHKFDKVGVMIELRKEKRKNHVVIREDDVKIDAIIKLFLVHFVGLNKNVRNRHNCKTYDFLYSYVCMLKFTQWLLQPRIAEKYVKAQISKHRLYCTHKRAFE